jgi:hypothetical protein
VASKKKGGAQISNWFPFESKFSTRNKHAVNTSSVLCIKLSMLHAHDLCVSTLRALASSVKPSGDVLSYCHQIVVIIIRVVSRECGC